jgi:hypothetical protein
MIRCQVELAVIVYLLTATNSAVVWAQSDTPTATSLWQMWSLSPSVEGRASTIRDGSGKLLGSSRETQGRLTLRDASGRTLGNSTTSGQTITLRDGSGRVSTTAKAGSNGTVTYRDASGRVIGTSKETNGKTVFRDGAGRVQATSSSQGRQTTFRDAQGRAVGTTRSSVPSRTSSNNRSR